MPEDLQDELGEANDMSVDELLKPPEPEEQEREREEEIRFRKQVVEIERNSQISQMKKAQIDAEAEQLRKSTQDFKSQMEENNKARRQFDGSLKQEDIREILNAEFFNEVKKTSKRHQDFNSGSRKYEGLFKRNLAHILSDKKADEVISQLKKKFKSSLGKDADNYIDHVLFPEAVIELYARAFQLSREDAEEKLLNTGADIEFSPPPTQPTRVISSPSDTEEDAIQLAREEAQRRKEKNKAENQRKTKKLSEQMKKIRAEEKEMPEKRRPFKFSDSDKNEMEKDKIRKGQKKDKAAKETPEQEKRMLDKNMVTKKEQAKREEKKGSAETIKEMVEERYAREKKHRQPGRSALSTQQIPR